MKLNVIQIKVITYIKHEIELLNIGIKIPTRKYETKGSLAPRTLKNLPTTLVKS